MLNDKWFLNLDIKKLFLNTTATVDATTALGATVDADVDINPWVFGVGVGIKL
jgi:outer membrane protein